MFPKKYEPLLFGLLLSGFMSFLVARISTFRATGLVAGFMGLWISGWLAAWAVAFPVVLFVAPLTRRVVQRLVAPD